MADQYGPDVVANRKVPESIQYSRLTPLAADAMMMANRIQPIGAAVFQDGNIAKFTLSSSDGFLDPSTVALKFNVVCSASTAADIMSLDRSAHSCISRLRVIASSSNQVLEDISSDYGVLSNILYDLQLTDNQRQSILYSSQGFDVTSHTGAVVDRNVVSPAGGGQIQIKDLVIPLTSGILSKQNRKLFPLCFTDLRVEITFTNRGVVLAKTDGTAAGSATRANVSYQNVEMFYSTTRFQDALMLEKLQGAVRESGLFLHCNAYKVFPFPVQSTFAAAQNLTFLLADRVKSLRALLLAFTVANAADNQRYQARLYPSSVSKFQIKIGSNYYPTAAADSLSEQNMHLAAAIGNWQDVGALSAMNYAQFTNADWTTATGIGAAGAVTARHCLGMHMDSFHNSATVCGVNTIAQAPVYLNVNCGTLANVANAGAIQLVCFEILDSIIYIAPDSRVMLSQ